MDKCMSEEKVKIIVYLVLRIMVIVVGIRQVFLGNYHGVFICGLTLVLFMIPSFVNRRFHIRFPSVLEIIVLFFIFAAEILGEVNCYYLIFNEWDTMLHTMNGFLMAAIGFALIDILNTSDQVAIKLTPFFVALTAICFSMTTGVVWEFFEFSMDYVFLTDMQKDVVVPVISSVMFNQEGINTAIPITIKEMRVNGQIWNYGGYIDIGIIDTMQDLFVNFIGAVVFSIIGVPYIKGRGKFAKNFILMKE